MAAGVSRRPGLAPIEPRIYQIRILITGAAGHLGQAVSKAFLEDGASVRALFHRSRPRNLAPGVEVAWGDVTRPDSLEGILDGIDAVVHLAGIVPPLTEQRPDLAARVNVGGTAALMDAVTKKRQRIPFVYASSTAVFGPCPNVDRRLGPDHPTNPSSVYARTKLQAEELLRESGIDHVILRLTSILYTSFSLAEARTFMVSIPLRNRVEICHPDDMAVAVVNAVERFDTVEGQTLLIAGGPDLQMHFEDVLSAVLGVFGLPLPPREKFATEPYPLHWYDTSRSQALLAYQSRSLDDYARDLASGFPAPLVRAMRGFIGPALGGLIVRLL